MKVGIMTFHRTTNYGTALQAMATVTALQELGYDAELIDYRPEYIERTLRTRKLKEAKSLKTVLSILGNSCLYGNQMTEKIRNFSEYISSIKTSKKVAYTVQDVKKIAEDYDVILSGSDQLWNENITGNDLAYFFPFEHPCKMSYASSFGVGSISDKRKQEIAPLIQQFRHVSVREKTAKKILMDALESEKCADIQCVIDPTLLVDKETWIEQATAKNELPSNGYILTYYMIETPILRAITRKLKEETGLPVVNIKPSKMQTIFHEGTNMMWAGPRDFLNCYAGASYVVTNSFHGTAFAINFEVPMYVAPLPVSMAGEVNSRLIDVLERYGLSSRWICTMEEVEKLEQTFDVCELKKNKEKAKTESVRFIKEALRDM